MIKYSPNVWMFLWKEAQFEWLFFKNCILILKQIKQSIETFLNMHIS